MGAKGNHNPVLTSADPWAELLPELGNVVKTGSVSWDARYRLTNQQFNYNWDCQNCFFRWHPGWYYTRDWAKMQEIFSADEDVGVCDGVPQSWYGDNYPLTAKQEDHCRRIILDCNSLWQYNAAVGMRDSLPRTWYDFSMWNPTHEVEEHPWNFEDEGTEAWWRRTWLSIHGVDEVTGFIGCSTQDFLLRETDSYDQFAEAGYPDDPDYDMDLRGPFIERLRDHQRYFHDMRSFCVYYDYGKCLPVCCEMNEPIHVRRSVEEYYEAFDEIEYSAVTLHLPAITQHRTTRHWDAWRKDSGINFGYDQHAGVVGNTWEGPRTGFQLGLDEWPANEQRRLSLEDNSGKDYGFDRPGNRRDDVEMARFKATKHYINRGMASPDTFRRSEWSQMGKTLRDDLTLRPRLDNPK